MKIKPNKVFLGVLLGLIILFFGCSSTKETTTTETMTITAIVPPIQATTPVEEKTVPVASLPESTQTMLAKNGFDVQDSVTVTEAEAKTTEGTVSAKIYNQAKKSKPGEPKKTSIAQLSAEPAPVNAEQKKKIETAVTKSPWQSVLDLVEENKWTIIVGFILLMVVITLVRKYL